MKLTKLAQIIKSELMLELQKKGSSLTELESNLKILNTGEGVYKLAGASDSLLRDFVVRPSMGAAAGLPGLAMNMSAAGGAAAGLTFDGLESSVLDLNSSLSREREKVDMIKRLTYNLKKEHGL
jgi:hypothetical protein